MTRSQRFLSGFSVGYAHMAAATIAGLWLTPFFLTRLGQDTYGLWLVGTQIIAYLLLMDLGIAALLPRETAYVTGRTGRVDAPELRALIEQTLTLACVQVPVVLIAAVAAIAWMPGSWHPLRVPLAVVLALFVFTFPLRIFHAALLGLQDLGFAAWTQFAGWALGTVVNVALVWRGYGLPALAAGWCVTQLLVVAACAIRLHSRFPSAMPRRLTFGGRGAREYVARSAWVSLSQTAQVLLNGTDVIVIGALLGPAAVVPYACTGKLVSVLANQPQAILQSAAPALSELRQSADSARLFQVSSALSQATLALSGLVACVVLAANAGFVSWWVGPQQFGGLGLTALLLAAMMIRHFNTTNVYALFCFGHERRLALTSLADGLVTIAASVVLVKTIGVAGAPLAGIAGVVLLSAPLNMAALSRETGVARTGLVTPLVPWFVRFALVAAPAAAAGAWLRPDTFLLLAVLSSAAAGLYALAVVTPLLRSSAGAYLQPMVARFGRGVSAAALRSTGAG